MAVQRLKEAAEKAKIELSSSLQVGDILYCSPHCTVVSHHNFMTCTSSTCGDSSRSMYCISVY